MFEKVIENWTSRLDYIRASRGSPMPDIIFKMPNLHQAICPVGLQYFKGTNSCLVPKLLVTIENQPRIQGNDNLSTVAIEKAVQ
ncbi:hypothetical protein TNCV_4919991 [Trichonephila clavipes]|nr:hypothetical protein TNCV_4919991 [Trichonephila clavipes]